MTPRKPYTINGIRLRGLLSFTVIELLTERPHHRDELISKLWGNHDPIDHDQALRNLLFRVKRSIAPYGLTISSKYSRGVKAVYWLEGKECQ